LQDQKEIDGYEIKRLGTNYGGWCFVEDSNLYGCTIISAGLGEDASFDVEFAAQYNARVVVVDPTPRAIKHFEKIISNLGASRKRKYSDSGNQPVDSYDLSKIKRENLVLVEKALWREEGLLKFFEPRNPQHVSYSIVNYQNDYSMETKCIEVSSTTVGRLLGDLNLNCKDIPIFKMDIEGAEIEVLEQMLGESLFPRQILVEFDELNFPTEKNFQRVSRINRLLIHEGYEMIKTDGKSNFLYYRVSD
jgi:FkbM family methyltransferase